MPVDGIAACPNFGGMSDSKKRVLNRKEFWREVRRLAFTRGWIVSAVAGTALSVVLPFASLLDPYRDQHSQFWTTFDRFGFAFLSIAIFWFVVIKHFLQSSYLVYAREIGTSHNTIETLNEKLTAIESKRPHFTIPYNGTAVTAWSDTVHFDFRFVNSGEAAAYNPGADVFACWVNEKDEALRVDRIDSVKEVLKDQASNMPWRLGAITQSLKPTYW